MSAGDTPDETAQSGQPRPPRPKRGAFPTPQSEIDKAPVFVPPAADTDDGPEPDEQSSADEDADKRR